MDNGDFFVTSATINSASQITFVVSPLASDPPATITVWVEDCFDECGYIATTTAQIVNECPQPTIASITPSTWFAGKTYKNVAIKGTGFITKEKATDACPVTQVAITADTGSVTVSNVTVNSATKIAATIKPDDDDPTETATVTVGTAPNTSTAKAQILSDTCQGALSTANKDQAAITRAENAWSVLQTAADDNDIDPALLAAIGVRETGFENVQEKLQNGKNGPGMGVYQLTNQPGVTAAQAFDLTYAANYAANMLSSNMSYFSNKFPAFTPDQLLQATAASYNLGPGGISGNPNTIDVGSAPGGINGNYGSNVVGLMSCFQQP